MSLQQQAMLLDRLLLCLQLAVVSTEGVIVQVLPASMEHMRLGTLSHVMQGACCDD